MKFIRLFLIYGILMSLSAAATAQNTTKFIVKGIVKNAATNAPIEGANVKVLSRKNAERTTDSTGSFSYNLPSGKYDIEVTYVGFNTKKVSINLNKDSDIEVNIAAQEIELESFTVKATTNKTRVQSAQMGTEKIDRKMALLIPAILGEVDIIKVLQLKPGVKNSGEGTSGISVRGGGTDQNLFLIDGTTVYNPNHLFGFFSTFNIDAIKDVQLYKASFPAEFSGRLSSVVEVNTLRGADSTFSLSGGIGLIASRLNVQGNLLKKNSTRKLTYNVAARRTYADVFTGLINTANKNDTAFNPIPKYYFYDMNARMDFYLSDKDQFFASFYHGRDFFKLDSDIFGTTFSWGNTAASGHWKHGFSKDFSLQSSVHFADYNYDLTSKFDRFDFTIKSGVRDYSWTNKFIYTGFEKHQIRFGADVTANQFAVSKFNISSTQADENLASGETINTIEGGFYVSDDWDISPKIKVNAGARLTYFNNKTTYFGFEPRLSLRYLINEAVSVKASYAKMQQYKHLVASSGASLPTDIWYPSTEKIKPEISDQVALGLTWNIGDKFLFTNEVYYKWMRQLVDYKAGANLFVNSALENEFVFGKGESYGNEVSVEKTYGKLRGWIGYTLAWSTRQFADINGGKFFFPRFDRRHELSVVASYPLTKRLSFSGSWTYYTGNAVTLPTGRTLGIDVAGTLQNDAFFNLSPVYPERSNFRMPDYHRLDLALILKLRPKRGTSDLTLSAYNAYSRLNAYFIAFQTNNATADAGQLPSVFTPKAITLFPIIPSITYNFKF
jgi:TonB dependent receptor/CarboxypepD_reg-like domain/TonB-dependent Receptor Plug Domain